MIDAITNSLISRLYNSLSIRKAKKLAEEEGKNYTEEEFYIPTEIRWRWRDTPSGTTATTASPNKHQPPTRALPHPDRTRAERKALSSWKDYMPEKLHTFLMATHGCSPAVPSTLRPGKCVRANRRRKRQRGEKNTRREEKGREGTFHDACYVRNLSSTAALSLLPLLRLRALGVIFQRTGKCSRYREKPPARRCTITYGNIQERKQAVARSRRLR